MRQQRSALLPLLGSSCHFRYYQCSRLSSHSAPSHSLMSNHLPLPHDYADTDTPQLPRHRPHDLDHDLFALEGVENPLPSPPYRRVPSTSQVLIAPYPEQSPAYMSRANLELDDSDMPEETHFDEKRSHHDEKRPENGTKGKHAVHYDDTPSPHVDRFEPQPISSRASSIAGTDDEDEESAYDWSGEEDLVDEEAKFEQAMGVKKKRKFGCIRCVSYVPPPPQLSTLIPLA